MVDQEWREAAFDLTGLFIAFDQLRDLGNYYNEPDEAVLLRIAPSTDAKNVTRELLHVSLFLLETPSSDRSRLSDAQS